MVALLFEKGAAESAGSSSSSPPPSAAAASPLASSSLSGAAAAEAAAAEFGGRPRLRVPQRNQVEMQCAALDDLLEADHRARLVWQAVCELPLDGWLNEIRAVEGHVGRKATDPRLLVALWVYATLEGVGSARELSRLCETHSAYRWLCGGVSVNYHLLADFRSQGGERWSELLTHLVAALLSEGLVTMQCVAQDGMRVRASAGKSSFRRAKTLAKCLEEARAQVQALQQLDEESPEELNRRRQAARRRAAEERQARVAAALEQCQQLQTEREASAKKSGRAADEARASTTDPEARTMKFPDGGYQPGINVQFSTDTGSGIIVGVEATSVGSDNEQLPPMLDQLEDRYDRLPGATLVDGGFATLAAIEAAESRGSAVHAPPKEEQKQLDEGKDPYAKKRGDSPAVAAWRARMGTAAGKQLYRLRGQTAEWVNAQARNRGLYQMPVRGVPKCRAVATLYAIAHNLLQAARLRAQAAAKAAAAAGIRTEQSGAALAGA